jgi:cytochrome P450
MKEFDPRDPDLRTDPYPIYQRLRETDPIHQSKFGYTVLSRYADVDAVLRAPGVSSEFYRSPTWTDRRGGAGSPIIQSVRNWMLMLDGAAHRRIRGVIGKVFTRSSVERLRPRIATEIDRLLEVVGEGRVDLISGIALPLPVTVTCELLGLPARDRAECRRWTEHRDRRRPADRRRDHRECSVPVRGGCASPPWSACRIRCSTRAWRSPSRGNGTSGR